MAVVAMKQLLEAGVHFGHQTRRWDPRMAEYIFQARNGIHIIDLQKTSKKLDEAYSFVKEQAEEGKTILFVGTKKQAQECVKEAAERCGMYYIDQRWLGGMLTNFGTIQKRIQRLKDLEAMEQDGTFDVLPKKEVILLKKEMDRLHKSCHRLIWLNPLLGSTQYEPLTRGIVAALPHVDDFLPVHNLASLEDLATHLAQLTDDKPISRSNRLVTKGAAFIKSENR